MFIPNLGCFVWNVPEKNIHIKFETFQSNKIERTGSSPIVPVTCGWFRPFSRAGGAGEMVLVNCDAMQARQCEVLRNCERKTCLLGSRPPSLWARHSPTPRFDTSSTIGHRHRLGLRYLGRGNCLGLSWAWAGGRWGGTLGQACTSEKGRAEHRRVGEGGGGMRGWIRGMKKKTRIERLTSWPFDWLMMWALCAFQYTLPPQSKETHGWTHPSKLNTQWVCHILEIRDETIPSEDIPNPNTCIWDCTESA